MFANSRMSDLMCDASLLSMVLWKSDVEDCILVICSTGVSASLMPSAS